MVTSERQDEIKLAHYLLERSLGQLTGRSEIFVRGIDHGTNILLVP